MPTDATIRNCIVFYSGPTSSAGTGDTHFGQQGIHVFKSDTDTTEIYNNTVYGFQDGGGSTAPFIPSGIVMDSNDPGNSHTYELKNNVCLDNGVSYGGKDFSDQSLTSGGLTVNSQNNLSSDATSDDWSGVGNLVDQLIEKVLVDAASNDFFLRTGSPAIRHGVNLAAEFESDALGIARPQSGSWDMGALLYQVSQAMDVAAIFADPDSLVSLTGFDSRSNTTLQIDPKANTVQTIFDGASRAVQTVQHLRERGLGQLPPAANNTLLPYGGGSITTTTTFDGNSRVKQLVDDRGDVTLYDYDTLDREIQMEFHDGSTRDYEYNTASDITKFTDENGSVFDNTYDAIGRKELCVIAAASGVAGGPGGPRGTLAQGFQYDGLSRNTFSNDTTDTVPPTSQEANDINIRYDSLSRVLEDSQKIHDAATALNATNTKFQSYPITEFTFPQTTPAERRITNTYDLLYRRSEVAETGTPIAQWQFQGPGRVSEVKLAANDGAGRDLYCTYLNNDRTRSSIQQDRATPAWGDQSSDRLGYDGAARLITRRYLLSSIDSGGAYVDTSAVMGQTTQYDKSSNKLFERELHAESRSHLYEPRFPSSAPTVETLDDGCVVCCPPGTGRSTNGVPQGGYDSINRLRQYQRGVLQAFGAYQFNGTSDQIEITGTPSFASDTAGTILTWIKFDDATLDENNDIVSFGGAAAANAGLFTLRVRGDGQRRFVRVVQNSDGGTNDTVDGPADLEPNQWYQVALTSSGSEWKVYVDGVEQSLTIASGSNSGNWFGDTTVTAPDQYLIGALHFNGSTGQHFDGLIGPVQIYSRALSEQEIRDYATRLEQPNTTGLQAYYPFTDTAEDLSGNGNDGTVTGATNAPFDPALQTVSAGQVAVPISLPNTDESRTYDLDGLGNWQQTDFDPVGGTETTQNRTHNKLNQITRTTTDSTTVDLTYDGQAGASNGNLADDGIRTYEWDALNRLKVVKRKSDGQTIGEYTYDAMNRRIRKVVSNGGLSGNITNGKSDYLYHSGSPQCCEERGDVSAPTKQYVWGIYVDELIQQKNIVALNGFPADTILYPLQDTLYRTTALVDSTGTVREAYDTDAYGNTIIFRNAGSPPGVITWTDADTQVEEQTCDFIFTGRRYDPESRIYFYRARYYVSQLGRFISRDPMGFESGSMNSYGYVGSQPITGLDASGMCMVCKTRVRLSGNIADFDNEVVGTPYKDLAAIAHRRVVAAYTNPFNFNLDIPAQFTKAGGIRLANRQFNFQGQNIAADTWVAGHWLLFVDADICAGPAGCMMTVDETVTINRSGLPQQVIPQQADPQREGIVKTVKLKKPKGHCHSRMVYVDVPGTITQVRAVQNNPPASVNFHVSQRVDVRDRWSFTSVAFATWSVGFTIDLQGQMTGTGTRSSTLYRLPPITPPPVPAPPRRLPPVLPGPENPGGIQIG